MKKAVILLSGGLDSATCLAIAISQGYACHALSIDYNQRNHAELEAARRVAKSQAVVAHHEIRFNMDQFTGSALTDPAIPVPDAGTAAAQGIPTTYVPARNTIFLSIALGFAEVIGSVDLFIGVNAVDYSGYPDCRPAYIEAFNTLANLATKAAIEGNKLTVHTPLIKLSKAEIIKRGVELGVDYGLTLSCYQPASRTGVACGVCDSCRLRSLGFVSAGITDPSPANL